MAVISVTGLASVMLATTVYGAFPLPPAGAVIVGATFINKASLDIFVVESFTPTCNVKSNSLDA